MKFGCRRVGSTDIQLKASELRSVLFCGRLTVGCCSFEMGKLMVELCQTSIQRHGSSGGARKMVLAGALGLGVCPRQQLASTSGSSRFVRAVINLEGAQTIPGLLTRRACLDPQLPPSENSWQFVAGKPASMYESSFISDLHKMKLTRRLLVCHLGQ